MKLWTRILLAVVAALVAAIAAIPLFVNANTFRPVIEKQLTQVFGREVTFGDLSLSVIHGRMAAKGLTVAGDPAFGPGPILTADELRIGIALRPLIFSHQLNIRSFEIDSPKIKLVRAENGTWNFSTIGHHVAQEAAAAAKSANRSAGATAPANGAGPSSAATLPDIKVGLVDIEDATVTAGEQPARGEPSVYNHVNISVHDFSLASNFHFDLDGDLPGGGTISVSGHAGPINRDDAATTPAEVELFLKQLSPVAAGFLDPDSGLSFVADLDMKVSSDGTTLTNSGTAHLSHLQLRKGAAAAPKPVDLSYKGTHVMRTNRGTIEDAAVQVGDAAIHLNGTYEPVSEGAANPGVNLKLAGQALPVDDLQPLMTAAGVRLPNNSVLKGGTLGLNLAITGVAKALVIIGEIDADKTRLVGFDVGSKIHGIAALSGVKTGDTTNIEMLRAHVRMSNAGVVVGKLNAVIPALGELSGSGAVSSANQLDFQLVAQVKSASGVGKVGVGLLSALNGGGDKKGVPLKIVGTPDEPVITADVGSAVGHTTKSIGNFFTGKKSK
ncbi:MAG: AsmA family protein [Candidatus Acidiferrales bacterium]